MEGEEKREIEFTKKPRVKTSCEELCFWVLAKIMKTQQAARSNCHTLRQHETSTNILTPWLMPHVRWILIKMRP